MDFCWIGEFLIQLLYHFFVTSFGFATCDVDKAFQIFFIAFSSTTFWYLHRQKGNGINGGLFQISKSYNVAKGFSWRRKYGWCEKMPVSTVVTQVFIYKQSI